MTYLVTGGTGFIGSHCVRDLARAGESIVIYDWFPETHLLEKLLDPAELDKISIVHGDVCDYAHLLRTLRENEITRIIHLAAMMLLEVNADPLRGVRVNCEGTVSVFEAARFLGLEKVVWASSGSVFGPPEDYAEEFIPNDARQNPQNIYGAAKSFDEFVAGYYRGRYGLDITALRFVMVYGAGQRRGRTARIIRELVANPALGRPGKVPAAADNVLGWTYVDDAARAVVLASRARGLETAAFSVRGDIRTVGEIAAIVRGYVPGADITLLPLGKSRSHTIMTCKYDTSRLEAELGFRPEWTVERGIKATMNAVRAWEALPPL